MLFGIDHKISQGLQLENLWRLRHCETLDVGTALGSEKVGGSHAWPD